MSGFRVRVAGGAGLVLAMWYLRRPGAWGTKEREDGEW